MLEKGRHLNVILTSRWADTMTSESTDGKYRSFSHPFLQACGMFLGEMMCMLVFVVVRYRRRKKREAVSLSKIIIYTVVLQWCHITFRITKYCFIQAWISERLWTMSHDILTSFRTPTDCLPNMTPSLTVQASIPWSFCHLPSVICNYLL